MSREVRAFARKQLDQKLKKFADTKQSPPPMRGWIRAIRDAIGMTGEQLARRIGVQKQRIVALEKGEVAGTVTINSMKKAAEAMDCVFVYALVPRDSLEVTVEKQARQYAVKLQGMIQHSMLLEEQGLSVEEAEQGIKANTDKFVRDTVKDMWELD